MTEALNRAIEAANRGDWTQAVALLVANAHGMELRLANLESVLRTSVMPVLQEPLAVEDQNDVGG